MEFESGERCGEVESLPEGTGLRGYWHKRDNEKEETARPGGKQKEGHLQEGANRTSAL